MHENQETFRIALEKKLHEVGTNEMVNSKEITIYNIMLTSIILKALNS